MKGKAKIFKRNIGRNVILWTKEATGESDYAYEGIIQRLDRHWLYLLVDDGIVVHFDVDFIVAFYFEDRRSSAPTGKDLRVEINPKKLDEEDER